MSAKTGQSVAVLFTTVNPAIGSAVDADATPVGTLYLNGVANGAAVTVTNLAAGLYKATVTMPTLAAGDRVSLFVAATVGGVTGKGIIWGDMGETATASDVKTVADGIAAKTVNLPAVPAAVGSAMVLTTPYDAAKTAAAPGAAMTLTAGERTSVATAVWAATTRTLSGFGTLAADVWASAARALTDKVGFSGTATNMVAAAPIATANADAVRTNLAAELAHIDEAVSAPKTLTSPYDAVKTAASATSVTALGEPMQAGNYTAPDNASAVAAAASAASVDGKLTATRAGYLDEPVSAAKTLTSGERTSIASAVSGLATTGLAALWAKLNAVLLKTDTIGTGQAIVQSPITASGTITVEQGDSYSAGRSRAIDVNVDDEAHAKGLDAENVTLYLLATQFTWTAASVTETAGGYRVRFEPTIAETAAVTALRQSYKLKAYIDNVAPTDDDAETIQRGTVVLNRDIPAVT